jgi:hypothetical protein
MEIKLIGAFKITGRNTFRCDNCSLKHRCLERGNKLHYFIQFLILCKTTGCCGLIKRDPKRSVAGYFIVNRDMINSSKNIEFYLSVALHCLPLGKFAVLMITVQTEHICRFFYYLRTLTNFMERSPS